jgi:hypothetical protein
MLNDGLADMALGYTNYLIFQSICCNLTMHTPNSRETFLNFSAQAIAPLSYHEVSI